MFTICYWALSFNTIKKQRWYVMPCYKKLGLGLLFFGIPPNFSYSADIISSGFSIDEPIYRYIFHNPNDTKTTPWLGKGLHLNTTGSIIKAALLINIDCSSRNSIKEEILLLVIQLFAKIHWTLCYFLMYTLSTNTKRKTARYEI